MPAPQSRVLVVDDESSVLITYRMILERQGYQVVAALSSREAMEALATQEFDLVLCDFSLDEQHTGFAVIGEARRRYPHIPAALLTGYATLETADQAAANDIAVLYKPIDIQEFLSTTSSLLRKKDDSQESGSQEDIKGSQAGSSAAGATPKGRRSAQRKPPE